MLGQIEHLARLNPSLTAGLRLGRDQATVAATGSRLDLLSSDAASSYGTIADFIICDELCHWTGPELWHSLYTAAAKQPHTVLGVLTNAGVGRDWRWEARERARRGSVRLADGTGPSWHFSTLDRPQASWIDPAFLDEQRQALPDPVFRRLWLNQWQVRSGGFLHPDEIARCCDPTLTEQAAGRPDRVYLAAIDYAEKHDRTAAIVCHLEYGDPQHGDPQHGDPNARRPRPRVVVDRLDVIAPTPEQPVPIAWVESWIDRQIAAFGTHAPLRLVLDEHQLLGTLQRYRHRLPVERFSFAAGLGNDRIARHLRSLILSGDVAWYPECGRTRPFGQPLDPAASDTLATELADLLVKERPNGRLRFDHPHGGHDDRAFVLAVACSELMRTNPEPEFIDISDWPVEGPLSHRQWFGRSIRALW